MAETNIVIRAIDKTQQAFNSVKGSLGGLTKALSSTTAKIGSLVGAAGFGAMTAEALSTADAIGKASTKLGIHSEELQKLQFAAGQSGVETEKFNTAMGKFSIAIGEAQSGNERFSEAFENLGVSLTDQYGNLKATEVLFAEVSEAIAEIEEPANKAASASDLFGQRAGVDMIPLLNAGKKGLAEYGNALEDTGGIMRDGFIRSAEATNDAVDVATKSISASFTVVLQALLPTIQAIAKGISVGAKAFGDFSKQHPELTKLGLAIGGVGIAITGMLSVLGGPITAGVLAVTGLTAVWVTFGDTITKKTLNAVNSVTGYFTNLLQSVTSIFNTLWENAVTIFEGMIESVVTPVKNFIATITGAFNRFVSYFSNDFSDSFNQTVDEILTNIIQFGQDLKESITRPIREAVEFVNKHWERLKGMFQTGTEQLKETTQTKMEEVKKKIVTPLSQAASESKGKISAMRIAITKVLGHDFADTIFNSMKTIKQNILNPLGNIGVSAQTIFDTLTHEVKTGIAQAIKDLTDDLEYMLSVMKEAQAMTAQNSSNSSSSGSTTTTTQSERTARFAQIPSTNMQKVDVHVYADLDGQVKIPIEMLKTRIRENAARNGYPRLV